MSSLIDQLTVYADVSDPSSLETIEKCAKTLCPSNARVITAAELSKNTTEATNNNTCCASLNFILAWERELGDIPSIVQNTVPLMRQYECFITEGEDHRGGAVAYALFRRQMPVLSLLSGQPGAVSHGRRISILESILYTTRSIGESQADAIARFLSLADKCGDVLAVEFDQLTRSQLAQRLEEDYMLSLHRVRQQAPASDHPMQKLVWLRRDGYPLSFPSEAGSAEPTHILPPLRACFDDLLDKIAAVTRAAPAGGVHGESAGEFHDVLQTSPQLYGALCAFSRYENRGILRYLLLHGYTVVFWDHTTSTAAELLNVLGSSGSAEDQQRTADVTQPFTDHLIALRRFEAHWLEMPLPARVVCLLGGNLHHIHWRALTHCGAHEANNQTLMLDGGSSGDAVASLTPLMYSAIVRALGVQQ